MKKILISYFSASGITKNVAEKIKTAVEGDLFEIEPVEKYTPEDLDWTNKNSRSSKEMNNPTSRPKIVNKVSNLNKYDIIVIGFPVWWYIAPKIINTFIEENNLTNKKIYIFVTSGGTQEQESFVNLQKEYNNLNFISAKRFTGSEEQEIYKGWLK